MKPNGRKRWHAAGTGYGRRPVTSRAVTSRIMATAMRRGKSSRSFGTNWTRDRPESPSRLAMVAHVTPHQEAYRIDQRCDEGDGHDVEEALGLGRLRWQ